MMMKTKGNIDNKIGHFLGLSFANLSAVHVFNNQLKCFIAISRADIEGQHWIRLNPFVSSNWFGFGRVWGFGRWRSNRFRKLFSNFHSIWVIGFYYLHCGRLNCIIIRFLEHVKWICWLVKIYNRKWSKTHSNDWVFSHEIMHAGKWLENVNSHTLPIIIYHY